MTKELREELLPCPFCGSTNIYLGPECKAGLSEEDIPKSYHEIGCQDCIAFLLDNTKAKAIEHWNTRPQVLDEGQKAKESADITSSPKGNSTPEPVCYSCNGEGRIPKTGEGKKVLTWQTCFKCQGSGYFYTPEMIQELREARNEYWRKSEIAERKLAILEAKTSTPEPVKNWLTREQIEEIESSATISESGWTGEPLLKLCDMALFALSETEKPTGPAPIDQKGEL